MYIFTHTHTQIPHITRTCTALALNPSLPLPPHPLSSLPSLACASCLGRTGVEYKYILVRTPATFPSQTPESPTLDYQEFLWESGPNRYVNLTGPSTIPIFSSDHDQVAELRPEGQGGKGVAAAPSSEPPLAAAGNENQGQGDQGEHLRHQLNAAPSCTDVRFEARYRSLTLY